MKHFVLAAALAVILSACQAEQTDQGAPRHDPAPVETSDGMAGRQPEPAPLSQPPPAPVDGAFQAPLPEGVVLTQAHYARMDIAVPGKNGAHGRRTEFEYLEGDADAAMQAFAASMAAAGFTSGDGPSPDAGVVRQVFRKEGYGTVFARAQPLDAGRSVHESAHGLLVAAWPAPKR